MKKINLLAFLLCTSIGFAQTPTSDAYASTIESEDLRQLLYVYASDFFQGRETGTLGQKRAVTFLKEFYESRGIQAAAGSEDYFQKMTLNIKGEEIDTENVVAIIEGSEKPEEYLVISSHLDHIGAHEGEINNGADDDGSGTVTLLEIAEAFQKAVADGKGPKRSVIFLHVTGEEKGLLGSRHYTDNDPIFPLENTVADLNIDMIGRTDPKRTEGDRNYVYLIGSDKLSTDLHNISEEVNTKYTKVELDYTYNDENDPNRFYYRSDHYNFAKNNIPVIFYFNGTHDDYHKASDTPDKIEYDLLENRTRLVFHTAWEVANRDKRIIVDRATE